ncbi:hypothetical protein [Pseudomonas sp. W4I3]|uniref:hypothetical protein n=1 Tax=Pseudomonas sp. W4I3 TaxID=3042294 RepID=UPI00277E5DB1|nr:hypothetical protein [Pseudomonas sp. W4I3]MDQ0740479.1 hypothetical protein [Pseudomonas sp. W4I3]
MKTTMMEHNVSTARINQAPQALLTQMALGRHSLKWLVTKDQLFSFWLEQQAYVVALKGRHWITSEGSDVCLEQGYFTRLAPSLILLEGEGEIELFVAPEAEAETGSPGLLLNLRKYLKHPHCTLKITLT